jgi:hypothetical protein
LDNASALPGLDLRQCDTTVAVSNECAGARPVASAARPTDGDVSAGRPFAAPAVAQHGVLVEPLGEVQHVVPSGLHLAGGHRARAARIDDHNPCRRVRLARKLLLLLLQARSAQIGDPVVQEVVGLGLVGIGADRHDGVGELGVLVAVVELAHAHVARGVHLGVVGRAVVDADVRRTQRAGIRP